MVSIPRVPTITDIDADHRFHALVKKEMIVDPKNPWIGGYVDYEWSKSRHVFEALPRAGSAKTIDEMSVLEFGCNMGASAIVLAALGARVTAIDVNESFVRIAKANAERYGLADRIEFRHVPDTSTLPYADRSFHVVSCNSVLEYVPSSLLGRVQREIDRVVKGQGLIVVLGTSNRIWPIECHSGLFGINYVPRALDRITGKYSIRGVMPWALRNRFGDYEDMILADGGHRFVGMKANMGSSRLALGVMSIGAALLHRTGTSIGMLMPNIALILRKNSHDPVVQLARPFSPPPARNSVRPASIPPPASARMSERPPRMSERPSAPPPSF